MVQPILMGVDVISFSIQFHLRTTYQHHQEVVQQALVVQQELQMEQMEVLVYYLEVGRLVLEEQMKLEWLLL